MLSGWLGSLWWRKTLLGSGSQRLSNALNIGGKSARFEALLGNKVPAAILDPPYTTMAAQEDYKLLVDLAPMDALSAQ